MGESQLDPKKRVIINDQSLIGPSGNWVLDAEGNCYFTGRLVVEGWIDPKWLTLTNQSSSGSIPDLSLFTLNNTLSYKDGSHNVKTIEKDLVLPKIRAVCVDSDLALTGSDQTVVSISISPTSSSNRILVVAAWTGVSTASPTKGNTSRAAILRGVTEIATYSADVGSGTRALSFGGLIGAHDSPATTSSTTYYLKMNKSTLSGTWTVGGASIFVMECVNI